MPCCLVPGCNVRGSRKTKTRLELEKFVKISFHRLPRAKSLRNCWLENLNIKNDDGKLTYTVCSLHFDESHFDRTSLSSVRLRDGAIPYVHKKFWTLTDRMNKIMESRITQSNEILNKNNHNESTIECTDILIKERDREHIKNDIKVVVGFDAQSIENIIEHTNEREQIILDTTNLYNQCKIQDDNHKKSINGKNKDKIFKRLDECKSYILNLNSANGDSLLNTSRFTGFLGFLICIDSLKLLYIELCEKKKLLMFIPMYKFNQDHIELLFGCIRAHNGCNNNPTCSQFKAAFKKILIHTELRPPSTGNCVPREDIPILHVSSSTNKKLMDSVEELETDKLFEILDYTALIEKSESISLSPFAECIVTYIAGFVVFSIYKKLNCVCCLDILEVKETEKTLLIKIKSRGGLIYPSNDVIQLCEETDRIIRALFENNKKAFLLKNITNYVINSTIKSLQVKGKINKLFQTHHQDENVHPNHLRKLCQVIIEKFIIIRLHYMTKMLNTNEDTDRQKFTKLLLFNGK